MLISCIFNCYLQYFILFYRYVDFINVMAYDYSGSWSDKTGFMAPLYSRSSDIRFDQTLSQVDNFNTISFFFFFFTSNGCIVKICFYVYMIQRKILIFFFKICIIIIKHPRGLHDTKSRRRIYTIVSRIYFSFLSFKTKI